MVKLFCMTTCSLNISGFINCLFNHLQLLIHLGLITDPIMQCQLFPTFQRCQSLYPRNVCVQKCFGEMMAACLSKLLELVQILCDMLYCSNSVSQAVRL